jgi:ATP-dependent Clp protease protease subunit
MITKTTKHGKDYFDLTSYVFIEKRKVQLIGEINDGTAMETVSQLEYLDALNDDDIYLYINSPGGSVSAGLAIVDAMNRCKSDIVTVSTGIAASMGAFIASCGKKGKRYVTPYAEVMLHQPLGGAAGQASDIEVAAAHIVQTKRRLNEILARNTGKSIEVIAVDTDRDFYMSALEAVEYGLVDSLLETGTLAD